MDRELFRTIISENQEYICDIKLVKRTVFLEDNGNYVFVGVRQAGKSYLLYQKMQEMFSKGKSIDEIVYINFDDERLMGMVASDFDLIIQAFYSMSDGSPVFFFDEIQNVEGWANFARRLANQKYQVFVTGSNAKMLSRDIQTVLGGRYLDLSVYPYSFDEYLKAVGVEVPNNWQYGRKANEIQRHFRVYFDWGGFPDLVRFREKRVWLNSLFSRIFFNDLVVRHKIKNEDALRKCVRRLAESVKQPCSLNRLSNLIKSTGSSCSTSTVMEYVRYLQEACIIFSLDNYASKFVEKESVKKHYFVDNGLLHLFINDADTSLLENLCALTLHKRYASGLFFYNRNIEVDFFVPDESLAIQSSYSLADESTRKREVSALVALNEMTPLKRAMIVTFDQDDVIDCGKLKIEVLSIWRFLLL